MFTSEMYPEARVFSDGYLLADANKRGEMHSEARVTRRAPPRAPRFRGASRPPSARRSGWPARR